MVHIISTSVENWLSPAEMRMSWWLRPYSATHPMKPRGSEGECLELKELRSTPFRPAAKLQPATQCTTLSYQRYNLAIQLGSETKTVLVKYIVTITPEPRSYWERTDLTTARHNRKALVPTSRESYYSSGPLTPRTCTSQYDIWNHDTDCWDTTTSYIIILDPIRNCRVCNWHLCNVE